MRVYRTYRCDFGHRWGVAGQTDVPESARDAVCADGHEAVTCQEEFPADEIQVLLRPAARVVDRVTGQVRDGGKYFLVLLDHADQELRTSRERYTWDEVVQLALRFRGKDRKRALDAWDLKPP